MDTQLRKFSVNVRSVLTVVIFSFLQDAAEADSDPDFDPREELETEGRMRTRSKNKYLKFSRFSHKVRREESPTARRPFLFRDFLNIFLCVQPKVVRSPEDGADLKKARIVLDDLNDSLDTDKNFQGSAFDDDDDDGGPEGDEQRDACVVEGCP